MKRPNKFIFFCIFGLLGANHAQSQVAPQLEFCGIFTRARTEGSLIQSNMQKEPNVLRKQALQTDFNAAYSKLKSDLDRYFASRARSFEDFTGLVVDTRIDVSSYFVEVALECPTNPVKLILWFSTYPDSIQRFGAADLSRWKGLLSTVNKNDKVQFSGNFQFQGMGNNYPTGHTLPGTFRLSGHESYTAVITKLAKK